MLSRGDWVWVNDSNPEYDGKLAFIVHDEGGNVVDVEFVDDGMRGRTRRCGKDRLEKLDPVFYIALGSLYWGDFHVE